MKNAFLPKISILLQFGGEICALLCSDDSIQILLILSQVWNIVINPQNSNISDGTLYNTIDVSVCVL